MLPPGSSNLPETRRAAVSSLFGLASDGVYICPCCYQQGGSLLHCPSTLTGPKPAVYFCCTILGVTSTGRYPASCPVKPGLSSSAAFRSDSRDHLSYLLIYHIKSYFAYRGIVLPLRGSLLTTRENNCHPQTLLQWNYWADVPY